VDAATATVIAAIISAIASISVAIITSRSRIGPAQAIQDTSPDNPIPPIVSPQRKSFRLFRVIGQILVAVLYAMAVIIIVVGYIGHSGQNGSGSVVSDLVTGVINIVVAAFFAGVGFWAQKRLNR
jgi:hypothetical protein